MSLLTTLKCKIGSLFSRDRSEECIEDPSELVPYVDFDKCDLTGVEDSETKVTYLTKNEGKPTVLFMDNYSDFESVVKASVKRLEKLGHDVYKDYNIILVFGPRSAREVAKLLPSTKIDYAFLDLTLGEVMIDNDIPIEVDGVDVAINILKNNEACKIFFLTSHTLSTKVPALSKYFKKYDTFIKDGILTDKHIDKNVLFRDNLLEKSLYNKV